MTENTNYGVDTNTSSTIDYTPGLALLDTTLTNLVTAVNALTTELENHRNTLAQELQNHSGEVTTTMVQNTIDVVNSINLNTTDIREGIDLSTTNVTNTMNTNTTNITNTMNANTVDIRQGIDLNTVESANMHSELEGIFERISNRELGAYVEQSENLDSISRAVLVNALIKANELEDVRIELQNPTSIR
jgi:hypothetical protein